MREIAATKISELVSILYREACLVLPDDVLAAYREALPREESENGRLFLQVLIENAEIAARERVPLCQDTGVAVVFARVGQEAAITGGTLQAAVDEGIARAVDDGYLRASVVTDPCFERINTGDNTPAILHTELVSGDRIELTVLPKGAGSENMGRLAMLKPSDGREGLVDFVLETVSAGGTNACPPFFLGIGVGGTMDKAAALGKQALLRKAGVPSADERLAALESDILEQVNGLGIGPGGFGGTVSCLGVAIEDYPCHIASLPVAVNIQCNSARRTGGVI